MTGPAAAELRRFETITRADPDLMRLLGVLRGLRLPQWRLVAGCLYQTVWNALTGRARGTGIKDYDLIY
ncbi:MAG: nucleotidyltransferase family protein, partial [Stellaceae bacterium]